MNKRKYTNIQELEIQILQMKERGKTNQEIANKLCLEKEQIANFIKRYNRKQRNIAEGKLPKKKGRPCNLILSDEQIIKQLKMENELLRNFLLLVGRR